jgi:carotenoid cleavage dioxygenase-like enzyme
LRFNKPFQISQKEIIQKIPYEILNNDENNPDIINKINGFYGIIGPDINTNKECKNLYELFIENGNIQGVFFNNGSLTYVKHYIRTDKLLYEQVNGKVPMNYYTALLFFIFEKINMLPNIIGVANTSIMNIKDNIFALYEMDNPYKINVNFNENKIETVEKVKINSLKHFSAHSKYNKKTNIIETIDYNILLNQLTFLNLNEDFSLINKTSLRTKYLPIVHNFVSTDNSIIFMDSPLLFSNLNDLIKNSMDLVFEIPIKLVNMNSYICIINKESFSVRIINSKESFYIFHYADCIETEKNVIIYASMYDKLDFASQSIGDGKYRKIIIDKINDKITIEKNQELEKHNLDFPLKYDDKVLLSKTEYNKLTGFVICKDLNIIHEINLNGKYVCGEPTIIKIEDINYLLSFAYDHNNDGYLLLINLINYNIQEIPIKQSLNVGFHSIFIENNNL